MADLALPTEISFQDIRQHGSEYDAGCVRRYDALHAGGKEFRECMDLFLIPRKVETSQSGIQAGELYKERKKWAHYINRAGGLIDWIAAATFTQDTHIAADSDYWMGLNDNADGRGTPLHSIIRQGLVQQMVHNRGYFWAWMPSDIALPTDADTMQAYMRVYGAPCVDDWEYSEGGIDLEWLRVYSQEAYRSVDYKPADILKHIWQYITDTEVYTYAAKEEIGNGMPQVATLVDVQPHDFGTVPVFDIRATASQWVMDRIADVAIGLYNAEAGLSYSVHLQAYGQPVLTVNARGKGDQVITGENAVMLLEPGEGFEFVTPPATAYEPQFKNIERLKTAFYDALQAMARDSASIPQAGRLSGQAIERLGEPLQILIDSLAWPIEEAVSRWIEAVKVWRGESDLEVRLVRKSETPSMDEAQEIIEGDDGEPIEVSTEEGVPDEHADTALNGAQVEALLKIAEEVSAGSLAKDAALAIASIAFPLADSALLSQMIGSLEVQPQPTEETGNGQAEEGPAERDAD